MAESTPPAVEAATVPDPTLVARAEAFTRERFVHEGEDAAVALAPGSARRRALDAALAEIERGEKVPSTKWRRRYSLLLGLERVLSEDEPRLADGTLLHPHQVDALSGTLVALLASTQNGLNGGGPATAAPVLAVDEAPPPLNGGHERAAAAQPEAEAEADEPEDVEPDDDEDDDEPEDTTPIEIEIEGLEDDDEDDAEPEPSEDESYEEDR